jgi:hypothetical protein
MTMAVPEVQIVLYAEAVIRGHGYTAEADVLSRVVKIELDNQNCLAHRRDKPQLTA